MRRLLSVLALLLAGACGKDQPTGPVTDQSTRAVTISPGSSIQAAIDAAGPGDVIHLRPGIYHEALHVEKSGIRIMGQSSIPGDVVLENPGDEENGIVVTSAGGGFSLSDVTVRGFEENGVLLNGVDGFELTRVVTENNGEYGLFPVRSKHGTIKDCTASGHTDTGRFGTAARSPTSSASRSRTHPTSGWPATGRGTTRPGSWRCSCRGWTSRRAPMCS
jgi:pectin methylesterase-like acyl-CoA thioesterase